MKQYQRSMLIYNGNAGQGDLEKTLSACVPTLLAQLPHLLILQTTEKNEAKRLCEQYGAEMDLVIVLGGDGTLHECVNGLASLEKRPVIALLPGGTCNDFSRALGMSQNLKKAAEEILSGEVVPVDVMQVNESFFLNFWGIGLVAETSTNIDDAEKALWGKMSYYLSAIRTIRQMDPFSYSIQCDGERIEGEAVMILVSNGNFIGAKGLPFNGIRYDDGVANLFIIKNTNLTLLKELLLTDVTADDDSLANEVLHFSGKELIVETDTAMTADTDGEVYMKTPAIIKAKKHHLRMIKPVVENRQITDLP